MGGKKKSTTGKRGRGQPTKYKPEYAAQAKSLMGIGLPQRDLAAFFEIDEATITHWKGKHPEFFNAIKKGSITGKMSMTKSLFELGQNGNVAAQIFWLCNRCPGEWKQTQKIEQTVEDRKILEVIIKNPDGTKTLAGRIFPHSK